MIISEIFKSISGESWQAGYLAVFIRTYGCPLNCSYCDSRYACDSNEYTLMSVDQIMSVVNRMQCRRIIFTGGEPLIQRDAHELVVELSNAGYIVEIETCGAVDITDYLNIPNVYITMDWKSISSDMNDKMIPENLYKLREQDVLKFVVSNEEDLDDMVRIAADTYAQCFVSPVFGEIEPVDIVSYLMNNNLNDIRFQLQIHKIVWDKDKRGV